jgi:hypothetical protein
MNWLKNKICDWFHVGGDVKRDYSGRINWQCRTCDRWAEPVDLATELLIVEADIRKAIRAREKK